MPQKNGHVPTLARDIEITISVYIQQQIAKIAQLVEHDLAKVGVAGSSPVFRSNIRILPGWWNGRHEGLKILWLHGCAGSSPASGTYK